MSKNENLNDSPYTKHIKNTEDALAHLKKGMFHIEDRIGEVFHNKFSLLIEKIHVILDYKDFENLDYEVYLNSILVDCRCLFLESKRLKLNSTIQNFYESRGRHELAEKINTEFVKKIVNGLELGEIIKNWVDKRIVHLDYLDKEDEDIRYQSILEILDNTSVNNLLREILRIAEEYEEFIVLYGKSKTDSIDFVLKNFY